MSIEQIIFLLAVIGAVVYLLVTAYVAKTRAEKSIAQWHYECVCRIHLTPAAAGSGNK